MSIIFTQIINKKRKPHENIRASRIIKPSFFSIENEVNAANVNQDVFLALVPLLFDKESALQNYVFTRNPDELVNITRYFIAKQPRDLQLSEAAQVKLRIYQQHHTTLRFIL